MSGQGRSNVGASNIYEAGDQRNVSQSEAQDAERYNEGQRNSHIANDSSNYPSYGCYAGQHLLTML